MPNHLKNIALIGTGPMAIEYLKVLQDLPVTIHVVGRGQQSCDLFYEKTGLLPISGGLEIFDLSNIDGAIICTGVEQLANCTNYSIGKGIKNLLVEKPGGMYQSDIDFTAKLARENNASVYIAYNRRFFESVIEAQKLIMSDGGVKSFNFEFTEWSHQIEPLKKLEEIKNRWLVANSSHVIDLAFYLGGEPKNMFSIAEGALNWHPKSTFAGVGKSENGAIFNYSANWDAPGRWGLEILTTKNKYIFRPLEILQVQAKGKVTFENIEIDQNLDKKYKPGLFLQTKYWVEQENLKSFLTINDQKTRFGIYDKILNGSENSIQK